MRKVEYIKMEEDSEVLGFDHVERMKDEKEDGVCS